MAEAEEGEAAEEDPADAGGDRPAAEGALRCWFYCLYGWGCWIIKVFFHAVQCFANFASRVLEIEIVFFYDVL